MSDVKANDTFYPFTRREMLEKLRIQLENERSTFEKEWRDLSDYILPRRSRFFVSDANKGDRRNQKIIDSTATTAARTLRAGMMSGITSPARPWFRLTTPDPALAESGPVKQWLHSTTQKMTNIFLKSNLYNVLPIVYGDMGVFGTGCMMMEKDAKNVIHFSSFPIGSFMIAKDSKGRVNTFFREFRMTVSQVIDKFAMDDEGKIDFTNVSQRVESLYKSKNTEAWVDICHAIIPNDLYNPRNPVAKFKKYGSVYYEKGYASVGTQGSYLTEADDKLLRESGYDYFPVLCPRWAVTGEDVYGTDCPGVTSIGDTKQLQTGEKRGLQAIDKQINPTMMGPSSLRTQKVSLLPGDITYLDGEEAAGYKPVHEVNFKIQDLEFKQEQVRMRIKKAFYEDLFLMLAQSDRRQITATEIDERKEEKLLALGPVLEQLNQDLLDPLIDIAFEIALELGLLDPPPEELGGKDLKVEYISVMAQAQKLVGLSGIERFTNYVLGAANIAPEILDKVNGDQLVDSYGDLTSVPPGIVRTDEETNGIRQARAEAQMQQQKLEQENLAAQTANTMASTPVEEGTALDTIGGDLGL